MPCDPVAIQKVLIVFAHNNVSEAQMEYLIWFGWIGSPQQPCC